jgi:hypothetical protein
MRNALSQISSYYFSDRSTSGCPPDLQTCGVTLNHKKSRLSLRKTALIELNEMLEIRSTL